MITADSPNERGVSILINRLTFVPSFVLQFILSYVSFTKEKCSGGADQFILPLEEITCTYCDDRNKFARICEKGHL